jgi:acetyl-CoA acetyltransferase
MPQPRIIGYGLTPLGRLNQPAHVLMQSALNSALISSGLKLHDLDGLVAIPSLSHPQFMEAHALATRIGLLPRRTERPVRVRTIDTGGAGPVSALLQAVRMVKHEKCQAVAIVAGDAVATLDTAEFLRRADGSLSSCSGLPSPAIPMGYGRVPRSTSRLGWSPESISQCPPFSCLARVHAIRWH